MASRLPQRLSTLTRLVSRPSLSTATASFPLPGCSSCAAVASTSLRLASRFYSTPNPKRPLQKSSVIKDEDIPLQTIVLVDPTTNTLLPPASLSTILAQLDRSRYSIQLVDEEQAICKILDKKQAYDKKKEKAQAKKAAEERSSSTTTTVNVGGPPKEVQLSWGVTAHDLQHKLKKAEEFLNKGHRLTVVVKTKSDAPEVPREGKQRLMDEIEQRLAAAGKLVRRPGFRNGMTMMEFARN